MEKTRTSDAEAGMSDSDDFVEYDYDSVFKTVEERVLSNMAQNRARNLIASTSNPELENVSSPGVLFRVLGVC